MIGKLTLGQGAVGAISYCYYGERGETDASGEKVIRGELLYSNEVFESMLPNGHLNVKDLGYQYHQVAALNGKVSKFLWHQTFNFPIGEKISNETMVKIARDFATDFGFEDNQYMVFRHKDKAHEHFHIVANRVNEKGKNTASDKHNYERIQQFCRKMEQKYKLQTVDNHRQKVDARHNRKNDQLERMKKILDSQMPKCKTLSELSIALKKQGVVVNLGRGISFTDQRFGITFKGSDLGRVYSRQHIEKNLGREAGEYLVADDPKFDGTKREQMRTIIDRIAAQTLPWQTNLSKEARTASLSASWKDFEKRLESEGVKLRLVKDEKTQNVIGAAFQMGSRRFVNGRELGEYYTAKALSLHFGRSQEKFEKVFKEITRLEQNPSKETGQFIPYLTAEPEVSTKMITTVQNAANETEKDLAKIADALRQQRPKRKRSRKL
ncbi:relaxase/mobilization nuclease domain-containing protein [Xanthocytophaga flava]|uniref:relaxase/mobilization nuclease domain-containing protein n=1 Tax=Xanthocytophaga flava TaxID=3048013 RepID=UPI0028D5C853|nr:relaxase/mobilization nuclease domain-containing protein [Xanthocytophaga flavus]MDJ1470251.1 relaxase/mobilization nuclease domain-containing protein [Xanthocytophaga flavus]